MPIQTAIDSISNSQGSPFGFKNRIINGAMVIDQRNAGAAVTPSAASQYIIDRFIGTGVQASKLTYQQVADAPVGFVNSLKILTASVPTLATDDQFRLSQCIEGHNVADLGWGTVNAQTITVSFRAKASVAGTYSVALWNAANGRSYVTTVSLTTSWATYSFTVPGDTTGSWATGNTTGIELIFDLGASTTYTTSTTNTWLAENKFKATGSVSLVSNAAATLNITGVQVERGTQATAFDYRDYGRELIMCQRYFWTTNSIPSSYVHFAMGYYAASTSFEAVVQYPQTMRTSPTITFTATNTFITDGFSSFVPSSIQGYFTTPSTTRIQAGVTGATAGQGVALGSGAAGAAAIYYSAEL
jgi:hypothetical protein